MRSYTSIDNLLDSRLVTLVIIDCETATEVSTSHGQVQQNHITKKAF